MINHGFTLLTDPSPFNWIGALLKPHEDSHNFAQYMPTGFEEYITVQHYFENENMSAVTDLDMNILIEILEKYTTTPQKAYMSLWEGYGWSFEDNFNLKKRLNDSCKIDQPHRKYFLMESSVANCSAVGDYTFGFFHKQFPNMIWPADRSWYVFQEIDFDITLIGGSAAMIQEIESCGQFLTGRFKLDEYMGNRFLAYWMEKYDLDNEDGSEVAQFEISKLRAVGMGIRAKLTWGTPRGVSYYQPIKSTLLERIKSAWRKG